MKFSCSREILDKQLGNLSRIVTSRHAVPVLAHILIETDGKIVRLSGTDLELAATTYLPATVEQEGTFTVPARLFTEFVHQNPDNELTFYLESYELVCKGERVTARITGLDADEFPPLPKVEGGKRVMLPAADFVAAVKQVVIACANDVSRPVLTGVLLTLAGETATLVATDSFRLVERTIPILPVVEALTVIIPGRSLQEVVRIAGNTPNLQDIEVELGESGAIFRITEVELYSRLLTGSFPKYQAIIPTKFAAEADVTTAELVQALRLTATFGQSGVSNVLIEVDGEGSLSLASYGTKSGSTKHTIYAVLEEGANPLKAAFNARFLLDACSAAGSPHVRLQLSGQDTPLLISIGDLNYTQLVMPIRLDV